SQTRAVLPTDDPPADARVELRRRQRFAERREVDAFRGHVGGIARPALLVAAVVAILGDRPAQAAPGRLDSGYVIEFPITGSPVQRSFLGDTWWELAWVIPMDAPSKMLVYPTGFCMSRR